MTGENGRKKSTVEEVEVKLENAGIVKPPDGGYGWIVVIASFTANLIVDGVIFTVGDALLGLWKADFQTGDAAAALAMSLLGGMYLLVGPLSSALANNYGCRTVAIVGGAIAFFGFLCSTIAPQMSVLYVTFGIIGGVGFGMVYLPAIVIVSQYFSEKRAFATGLAVCGSGIGTSIFATLNPIVMGYVNHNWRLFLVFTACASLIGVVAGLFFKPLQPSQQQLDEVARIAEQYEQEQQEVTTPDGRFLPSDMPIERLGAAKSFDTNRPFLSTLELNAEKSRQQNVWSQHDIVAAVAKESVTALNRPLSRQDVFYPGSSTSLAQRTKSVSAADKKAYLQSDQAAPHSFTQSNVYLSKIGLPEAEEPLPPTGLKRYIYSIGRTLASMVDRSLLRMPSFFILAISGFLTLSCLYVPFAYLGRHLERIEGLTQTQKSLPITVLGIINIVFRILCGKIADSPKVDSLWVSNIGLIVAGLATIAVPFFTAYWHFFAFCVPFAFGLACFAALRSVICVDLFGLERLSSAFGTLLLFMGVGALIGSPLAAFIKDQSGNFDLSFYVMGAFMTLSGVICIPLRAIRNAEEKRFEKDVPEVELERLNA